MRKEPTSMIEIISHGRPRVVKKFSCKFCDSIFIADEEDYKLLNSCGLPYYAITCPVCGKYDEHSYRDVETELRNI